MIQKKKKKHWHWHPNDINYWQKIYKKLNSLIQCVQKFSDVFKPLLWAIGCIFFTKCEKQIRATNLPFCNWVCFLKSDIWSLYSEWITQGIEFQKTRWPLGLKKKNIHLVQVVRNPKVTVIIEFCKVLRQYDNWLSHISHQSKT